MNTLDPKHCGKRMEIFTMSSGDVMTAIVWQCVGCGKKIGERINNLSGRRHFDADSSLSGSDV